MGKTREIGKRDEQQKTNGTDLGMRISRIMEPGGKSDDDESEAPSPPPAIPAIIPAIIAIGFMFIPIIPAAEVGEPKLEGKPEEAEEGEEGKAKAEPAAAEGFIPNIATDDDEDKQKGDWYEISIQRRRR